MCNGKRDNIKINNSGTSFGVTNGNVKNDNRVITIHQTAKCPVFPIACIALAFVLLLAVSFFFVLSRKQESRVYIESVPENIEIRIGPRGGVYYVDDQGKRHYIDRKEGLKLYERQEMTRTSSNQKEKEENH